MRPLRVVFITRRFWPRWDGASRTLDELACALVAQGGSATVLTVLEHSQWPKTFDRQGTSVVRLPYDRESRWAEIRYMRSLARWLHQHRGQYDLVYVSGLRWDAYAVMGAVGRHVPVVLRAEAAGRRGDCLWQLDAPCGRRIKRRLMKAAALIGPSDLAYRELIAAGYPRSRVHSIPHGTPRRPPHGDTIKKAARATLGETHSIMMTADWTPLAVYVGTLQRFKGLRLLVRCWGKIVERWPSAQLWLVGEGSYRKTLQEMIDARNLSGRVVLVGHFDQPDTVLDAADLFVLPSPEEDMPVALLEAMAAGLPVVACDNAGNREIVIDGQNGLLVPPADGDALSAAMTRLLDEPDWAGELGTAAKDRVERDFPLAKMVDSHVRLFAELLTS